MKKRTKEQAKWEMENYKRDQLCLYIDEAGFESWMMEYTKANDLKNCTPEEREVIESIQEQMWLEVHYWF